MIPAAGFRKYGIYKIELGATPALERPFFGKLAPGWDGRDETHLPKSWDENFYSRISFSGLEMRSNSSARADIPDAP